MPPTSQPASQPEESDYRKRPRKRALRSVHRQAIRLFAEGKSPAEVAAETGVSRWTAWRWYTGRFVPAIAHATAQVRDDRLDRAEWYADPVVHETIEALRDTLHDPGVPHAVRADTAVRLLDRMTFRPTRAGRTTVRRT